MILVAPPHWILLDETMPVILDAHNLTMRSEQVQTERRFSTFGHPIVNVGSPMATSYTAISITKAEIHVAIILYMSEICNINGLATDNVVLHFATEN
jgi:hypothetical protein